MQRLPITHLGNQLFSIVLTSLFVDTLLSLDDNEKIFLRIKHSKVGNLLFTNIVVALL